MAYFSTFFSSTGNMLLLAFGFGFVIFWHELGHFLAAKWADVKVEQFAVGFGQAMLSWRKGLGFRWGSTQDDYQRKLNAHWLEKQVDQQQLKEQIAPTEAQLSAAAAEMGISETEYRLNWIPLGGYVKMLGQDDMKPGQVVSDPRSYNNKTIAQRMVIVSAGVVMNVILAALGFMYIFTVGFKVPEPVVGLVVPGSPAQKAYKIVNDKHVTAPLQVGDRVVYLNGKWQSDFEKIKLNTALMIAGETVPMDVQHLDGSYDRLYVTPAKASPETEFPLIGIGEYIMLQGPPMDAKAIDPDSQELKEFTVIGKGDVITEINGIPVKPNQFSVLDSAMQVAGGKPVDVTITNSEGATRPAKFNPHFVQHFGDEPINFAGMQMLTRIDSIQNNSTLVKDLQPGDVVINLADPSPSGDQKTFPAQQTLIDYIRAAGERNVPLEITVLRGNQKLTFKGSPTVKIAPGKLGFGIKPDLDESTPIVARPLIKDSPAEQAGVPIGSKLISIDGKPVHNWFDVNNIMAALKPNEPFKISAALDGTPKEYALRGLTDSELDAIRSNHLESYSVGMLIPDEYLRKTSNLWTAANWGVGETRDAILQVYQTIRSMVKGSISPSEVSGPLGILTAGYMVAERGTTRLIWFLSIISANLAVMNFLPIPIVDGGLFSFLVIEKIKGSPISPRVQAAAQVVGLAILLSVFLFATYQDVFHRLPSLFR